MKFKVPKKFGTIMKISAVTTFSIYAAMTSKVEVVSSLTPNNKSNITQSIVEYKTYEEINHNLSFGEKNIIQTGMNGLYVEYNGVKIEVQKPRSEIIEIGQKFADSFSGSITGYGPDCYGCSGKIGYGIDVTNGNIYYNDEKYGKLRILAADAKYPYGSIFRISNLNIYDEPIIGIVLDRGGAIKGNIVDLLFETENDVPSGITQNNILIDVIRYGW